MPYIGSFEWYDPNNGWYTDESVNSSNMDNFLFAASCCSMGATFKINWANYQQTSSQMSNTNQSKRFFFEKPNIKIDQKIINLSISNKSILVKNVSIGIPNPKIVRDTFLRKDDIYGLEFYDQNNDVIY